MIGSIRQPSIDVTATGHERAHACCSHLLIKNHTIIIMSIGITLGYSLSVLWVNTAYLSRSAYAIRYLPSQVLFWFSPMLVQDLALLISSNSILFSFTYICLWKPQKKNDSPVRLDLYSFAGFLQPVTSHCFIPSLPLILFPSYVCIPAYGYCLVLNNAIIKIIVKL